MPKDIEKYNALHRNYYHQKKTDPEWKEKFNASCRENVRKYRERLREQKGLELKPRGRPRKIQPVLVETNLEII